MKLQQKLMLSFLTIIIISALGIGLNYLSISNILKGMDEFTEDREREILEITYNEEIQMGIFEQRFEAQYYLITSDEEHLKQYKTTYFDFRYS